MDFEIIPLARRKMARRDIPAEWVKQTLDSPDQVFAGCEGRGVAQKRYNLSGKKMLLGVVFDAADVRKAAATACLTL